MYAEFFGLQRDPFSIAPDPRYLYMSERHREALAHLLYGVRGGGGFVLLSGEIGAGKTTICRCFLEQVPENCKVAYIFNPKLTVGDLLRTICSEFHIEVKHEGIGPATVKDHLDPLNAYLMASHARGERNLLIIDEAQNLTPHVLEQLRLLTNLETSERKLLQIILIGQPELRDMVARPELEQLAQRVIARYHLEALDADETRQYIQHRLQVAGLKGPPPFSSAAIDRIHTLSRGVPRRINLLCDRSMLGAYATGQHKVERATVDKAAAEVLSEHAGTTAQRRVSANRRRAGTLGWRALGVGAAAGALIGALVAAGAIWWWTQQRATSSARAPSADAQATLLNGADTRPPTGIAATAAPASGPTDAAALPTAKPTPASAAPADTAAAPQVMSGWPPADRLQTTEDEAWRELASLWQVDLPAGDPCAMALRAGLQCYRTNRMTLNGLKALNRPGVLRVRDATGDGGWLLLTGLSADEALLGDGARTWRVAVAELDTKWQGQFATLWRLPPGQTARLIDGRTGPAADWLDAQLAALQRSGWISVGATSMQSRLTAFQRAQGIDTGGPAGPVTFMQINLASGVDEPRLVPKS
ncbi:MAG: AAA family ATPase [Hydrogenophaga sp.]|uniref:ExeA family protein n=1 Tax=Hydrogenophaga sp. TaxID=1904254 RepID=UPI001DE77310|nr:AAA family ATPase [Hydrogenophaga sp.]MBX3611498.1 AAA family ATPase [Hydrogenophaga sp.]